MAMSRGQNACLCCNSAPTTEVVVKKFVMVAGGVSCSVRTALRKAKEGTLPRKQVQAY